MSQKELTLLEHFEPQTQAAWEEVARITLKGKPLEKLQRTLWEGIEVPPFHTNLDIPEYLQNAPNTPPFARGSKGSKRAEIRQAYFGQDLNEVATSTQLSHSLDVDSHWFVSDSYAQRGYGLPFRTTSDLKCITQHLDLNSAAIFLDTGASALPLLSQWRQMLKESALSPSQMIGGILADPLGTLARKGRLPDTLPKLWDDMACGTQWLQEHAPAIQTVCISGLPYHDAGAHTVQEIAAILSTLVSTLRELSERGLSLSDIIPRAGIRIGIGRDMFTEIAKIRALRVVISKVLSSCGLPAEQQHLSIHACTSRVTASRKDHWVNLLRGTTECFSAVSGGADAITLIPFDQSLGTPSPFAQRQAITTQLILAKEAHTGRVLDPAGGSWYIEELTDNIARKSWALFQSIEGEGGIAQVLQNGSFREQILAGVAQKKRAVATRKTAIIGVSEYANPEDPNTNKPTEQPLELDTSLSPLSAIQDTTPEGRRNALLEGAKLGHSLAALFEALHPQATPVTCDALSPFKWSEDWEVLREASDAHLQQTGKRPCVLLANLGSIPEHKARAGFAQRFFEAGGFDVQTNEGFASPEAIVQAFLKDKADGIVICGKDSAYREQVAPLLNAFRQKPPSFVALAGKAGQQSEAWKEAGLSHEIYMGCDAIHLLQEMQHAAGVGQ